MKMILAVLLAALLTATEQVLAHVNEQAAYDSVLAQRLREITEPHASHDGFDMFSNAQEQAKERYEDG